MSNNILRIFPMRDIDINLLHNIWKQQLPVWYEDWTSQESRLLRIAQIIERQRLFNKVVVSEINDIWEEILEIKDRLDSIEDRLNLIEGRLDIIEERLDIIDGRLDAIENRLDDLESRMTSVEDRVSVVENRVSVVENRVTLLEDRVSDIELRLAGIDQTLLDHELILSQHTTAIEHIVEDISEINSNIVILGNKTDQNISDIEDIETSIITINNNITSINESIEEISENFIVDISGDSIITVTLDETEGEGKKAQLTVNQEELKNLIGNFLITDITGYEEGKILTANPYEYYGMSWEEGGGGGTTPTVYTTEFWVMQTLDGEQPNFNMSWDPSTTSVYTTDQWTTEWHDISSSGSLELSYVDEFGKGLRVESNTDINPATISIANNAQLIIIKWDHIVDAIEGKRIWMTRATYGNEIASVPSYIPTSINSLSELFRSAKVVDNIFNSIEEWDVYNIIMLDNMFRNCTFNIPSWLAYDISSGITTLLNKEYATNDISVGGLLRSSRSADPNEVLNLSSVDTSKFSSLSYFFGECEIKIEDVFTLTPNITSLSYVFSDIGEVGPNAIETIRNWDTSNVTNMVSTFSGNPGVGFNGDISDWDTSNVTIMNNMFRNNKIFNQDISGWNVSNVINHTDFDRDTNPLWTSDKKPTFPTP